MDAQDIIRELKLEPLLPEGGYFCRTYISKDNDSIQTPQGKRPLFSCIYYLIEAQNFSKLHRLKSDEIYHFYYGAPVEIVSIGDSGTVLKQILGTDILKGERPQIMVPRNTWQGSKIHGGNSKAFTLLGTTVSPAFDFEDFEMADREHLTKQFPAHSNVIKEFT